MTFKAGDKVFRLSVSDAVPEIHSTEIVSCMDNGYYCKVKYAELWYKEVYATYQQAIVAQKRIIEERIAELEAGLEVLRQATITLQQP